MTTFKSVFTKNLNEGSDISREDLQNTVDDLNDEYGYKFYIPKKHQEFVMQTVDNSVANKMEKTLKKAGYKVQVSLFNPSKTTLKITF